MELVFHSDRKTVLKLKSRNLSKPNSLDSETNLFDKDTLIRWNKNYPRSTLMCRLKPRFCKNEIKV